MDIFFKLVSRKKKGLLFTHFFLEGGRVRGGQFKLQFSIQKVNH